MEEFEPDAEDQRAMLGALGLLAKWLCHLGHECTVRERNAA